MEGRGRERNGKEREDGKGGVRGMRERERGRVDK